MSISRLLSGSDDKSIVDQFRRNWSDPWSAKATAPDSLFGRNTLGILLMELREELRTLSAGESIPMHVPSPPVKSTVALSA